MTPHPCPQCQGSLVYTHSNPNMTAGIVLLILGVLLAPVCIGIPMIIIGAVMMSQQKIAWHCSNCGRIFPTVRSQP